MADEEIQLGFIPKSDGSDYDPHSPQPTFNQILLEAAENDMEEFVMVVIGDLESPKAKVTGISKVFGRQDIVNARKNVTSRKSTYNREMQQLYESNIPFKHVSAVVLKKVR